MSPVGNDLLSVRAKFSQAGVLTELIEDRLEIPCGKDTLYVRVMADPGHPPRVHLRSLTPAGEVTISTQRFTKLKLLVDYTKILLDAAARTP
jgi:hypothetical protein